MKFDLNLQRSLLVLDSRSDPRTQKWPLVESGYFVMTSIAVYLLFILFGIKVMKNKKPFNLKFIIIIYNFILVALSAYLCYLFVRYAVMNSNFDLLCFKMDYSEEPNSVMLAWAVYLYYISKLVELFDTVFFVLRKKNNQISFLHVYHHASMPFLWWLGSKFVPGGESYLSPLINSLVHVFMYLYYGLSAFGPNMQPYLWWKKYITVLQMWQFAVVIVKTLVTVFSGCIFPNAYLLGQLFYMLTLLVLFSNFYTQSYKSPRQPVTNSQNRAKAE